MWTRCGWTGRGSTWNTGSPHMTFAKKSGLVPLLRPPTCLEPYDPLVVNRSKTNLQLSGLPGQAMMVMIVRYMRAIVVRCPTVHQQ